MDFQEPEDIHSIEMTDDPAKKADVPTGTRFLSAFSSIGISGQFFALFIQTLTLISICPVFSISSRLNYFGDFNANTSRTHRTESKLDVTGERTELLYCIHTVNRIVYYKGSHIGKSNIIIPLSSVS